MENWRRILRETIEAESMGPRKLYNTPGEVTKKLDSIVPPNPDDPNNPALRNKKALISIGYITDAKTRIEMPNKVKRRNLVTRRERSYNDYSELGEGIAGLVCVTCYNYNYQHSSFVNYDYGTRYIPQRDALRVKYGIPPVKKKEGIEGNPGEKMVDPDEIPQNMASELHKKRYYYPIDLNGRVLRDANKKPLFFDEKGVAQFVKSGDPRDAYEGVTALKKIQNDNKIIDQYVDEYKSLKMVYKIFKAPQVLYISGYDKINGEKFGYVNPQAIRSVSDIDINPQDFYEIGYERYRLAFKKFDEQQAAQQATQEEPAMAMSTESRNMNKTMRLTESEVKQLIRESVKSIISEIVDPTVKIQQLIQQANDAYNQANELQGGTEWPLMDKEGNPYGLSGSIKLDGRGYVIIPFNGGSYSPYNPEKIKVLARAGGRIRVYPGDYMNNGWKDARKMLNQIIRDANIGNGHFQNYDPNWENSDSPEVYKANKEALRTMNKQIGRKASAGMDYLSKDY